jgi:hypothetical protein
MEAGLWLGHREAREPARRVREASPIAQRLGDDVNLRTRRGDTLARRKWLRRSSQTDQSGCKLA